MGLAGQHGCCCCYLWELCAMCSTAMQERGRVCVQHVEKLVVPSATSAGTVAWRQQQQQQHTGSCMCCLSSSRYLPYPQERAALESMRVDFEAQLQTARAQVAKAQVSAAASLHSCTGDAPC